MVECKSASTMVKPTDVCQQMREDKTSAAHKDCENEQNSVLSRSNFRGVRHAYVPNNAARGRAGSSNLDLLVLNSLKDFFADLIACARAYDHRNESVLLIGGGYLIVLPPNRINRPPI